MPLPRVAILGATGHIAKGLIHHFLAQGRYRLFLFARAPERVKAFLDAQKTEWDAAVLHLDRFGEEAVDVVINCIGVGDPGKLRQHPASIFDITGYWDDRILKYAESHPEVIYVNLSSGAAYGGSFSAPADACSQALFPANDISPADYYGVAKLHSEARHRAAGHLNIIDLRVFSYFSRFIDLQSRFLLTDVVSCLSTGNTLITAADDIVRDYVHPRDLATLVELCMAQPRLNQVYDVYSRKPVTKFDMLRHFAARYGLRYEITGDSISASATGAKYHYYSHSRRAAEIGYHPRYSSLDGLCFEMEALLNVFSLQ